MGPRTPCRHGDNPTVIIMPQYGKQQKYATMEHNRRRSILIDTRDGNNTNMSSERSSYTVNLPAAFHDVIAARVDWLRFFDAHTGKAVNVFAEPFGIPYIIVSLDPLCGTWNSSPYETVQQCTAVIDRNDYCPGDEPDFRVTTPVARVQRLNVCLQDAGDERPRFAGLHHAMRVTLTERYLRD